MVLLIYPYGHPAIDVLAAELYRTKTLYSMYPVSERAASVKAVLGAGITVVVPDNYEQDNVFLDVLLALRACQHPIRTVSQYLKSLTNPASAHAAPTPKHAAGAGSTTAQHAHA